MEENYTFRERGENKTLIIQLFFFFVLFQILNYAPLTDLQKQKSKLFCFGSLLIANLTRIHKSQLTSKRTVLTPCVYFV